MSSGKNKTVGFGYLSDDEYRIAYGMVPRLCVDLVIQDRESQILLVRREQNPHKGAWHLPGGRVKKGESVVQAAKRVGIAEVGMKLQVRDCLGYIEFPRDAGDLGMFHSVSIVLLCCGISPEGLRSTARWFSCMPDDKVHPIQREFLEDHGLLIKQG